MYILFRNEVSFLRKSLEEKGFPVVVLPEGSVYGSPRAVLLYRPSLSAIRDEISYLDYKDLGTRLIIVTDRDLAYLIQLLFPAVHAVLCIDSPTLAADVMKTASMRRGEEVRKKAPVLTDPERRLLEAMEYGVSNKELAVRMHRSERTVRRIKESLFVKTGLVSSQQLMLYSLFSVSTRSS